MSYVARIFNKKRGLAVGLIFSGTGVGLFVLAPLTRYLISSYGWRLTFVILASGFIVLALPVIWVFREKTGQVVERGGDVIPNGSPDVAPVEPAPPERFHWKNRTYWTLCGLHYFDCICHSVPLVHVVAYATDKNMTPAQGAGILGLVGLSAIVGRVTVPTLTDRIGSRNGLMLSLFLQTGIIPFLMISNSLIMFYIFAVIFGFGWGGNSPMYPLLAREYFGPKRLGAIYGGTVVAASLGMAAGGYMGGLLFDISGTYLYSLLFSLTAGLISIGLILFLRPLRRRSEDPRAFHPAPATISATTAVEL
jgi:MFS family permease